MTDGMKQVELLRELHGKARGLREDHEKLSGNVADLLQHLRGRMEAAKVALRAGDVEAGFRLIDGTVKALQASFLSSGGAGKVQ